MHRHLYRNVFLKRRNHLRTQIQAGRELYSTPVSSRWTSTFPICSGLLRTSVSTQGTTIEAIRRNLATSSVSPSAGKTKTKSPGDIFLDNLGTVFLSAIGILILSLMRSSKGTSNKNDLRKDIEYKAALDPFEIDDLRAANDQFTPSVFREIYKSLENEYGWSATDKVDYKSFVSAVMQVMKGMKGNAFTIELGFLIDRVVASILEDGDMLEAVDEEGKIAFSLLLVVLSLAINGSPRERIEILFDILKKDKAWPEDGESDSTSPGITEKEVVEMVSYLQKSCQLVPDAQIIESTTKYPVQEYKVASPVEMVVMGKISKKDFLSDDALREDSEGKWSCDDFHHLLRSRSVCAWGECYVKKKSLV